MENKSTKQLIEAANRKCEMRWKVLAFNPDEDNKLVKEFKDFDCIDCAVAKKREYLEKNPTHVVEVISESKALRNEDKEFTIKLVTPFGKAKVCSWRAASVNDAVKEFLDANPAYRENKKGAVIAESCEQKNEALYKIAKTNKEKEEILAKIEKDPSLKLVSIDNVVSGWKDNKNGIPIAQYNTRITYKKESSQKNEGFYKYIDDVPTEEIAKALKELGIKEPYATQKAKIADKLAKHFGLRRIPTPIEMVPVLNALPYFKDESSQKNEALDEHELKTWLNSEHSRALKNIKNMAANDSSSFFKGYATALHEIQRKFGL